MLTAPYQLRPVGGNGDATQISNPDKQKQLNSTQQDEKKRQQTAVNTALSKRSMNQRCSYSLMLVSVLAALLASATFLILFSIATSHCSSSHVSHLQAPDGTPQMRRISQTICALEVSTRYWLLAMLGVNVVVFLLILPKLTHDFCQLSLSTQGYRKPFFAILALIQLLSTCMLVGWMYQENISTDYETQYLPIIHCAAITLLFSSLVLATTVCVTLFLVDCEGIGMHTDVQADDMQLAKSRMKMSQNSTGDDLEAGRSGVRGNATVASTKENSINDTDGTAATRRGQRSNSNSIILESSSQLRHHMSTHLTPAPEASPPPLHTSGLVGKYAGGMSLTEIKQIYSQIIPCCTPKSMVDQSTGEIITLPCCEHAPVLPTVVLPVGLTSPRKNDHGPVADLTDAQVYQHARHAKHHQHHHHVQGGNTTLEVLTSPQSGAQTTLIVPAHLHLDTHSPEPETTSPNEQSAGPSPPANSFVDVCLSNSPLALNTTVGSPLHTLLTHGPLHSPIAVTCTLCCDAYIAHQIIKILPRCQHSFHSACIVPYLKYKRDCPKCKVVVMEPNSTMARQQQQHGSSSESEEKKQLALHTNRHHELSELKMFSPVSTLYITSQNQRELEKIQKENEKSQVEMKSPRSLSQKQKQQDPRLDMSPSLSSVAHPSESNHFHPGTPDSMKAAIAAAASPLSSELELSGNGARSKSVNVQPTTQKLHIATGTPAHGGSTIQASSSSTRPSITPREFTVDELKTCHLDSLTAADGRPQGFEYTLDSVKLTPFHGTQGPNVSPAAATSPKVSSPNRSPRLTLSPIMIPKD